jgi:prophage regulatory protein
MTRASGWGASLKSDKKNHYRCDRFIWFYHHRGVRLSAKVPNFPLFVVHSPTYSNQLSLKGTILEANKQTPGRLLRLDRVEDITGLRKSSIYTYMAKKEHGFPTPVRIGARAVAWRESDVLAWIAGRTEARTQGDEK